MANTRKKKTTKKVVDIEKKELAKKVVKPKQPIHKDLLDTLNKAIEITDDVKELIRLGNRVEFGNRMLKAGSELKIITRKFR